MNRRRHLYRYLIGLIALMVLRLEAETPPRLLVWILEEGGAAFGKPEEDSLEDPWSGGVRLTNCFGVGLSPLADRVGLETGIYPTSLGMQSDHLLRPLPESITTVVKLLGGAGYQCYTDAPLVWTEEREDTDGWVVVEPDWRPSADTLEGGAVFWVVNGKDRAHSILEGLRNLPGVDWDRSIKVFHIQLQAPVSGDHWARMKDGALKREVWYGPVGEADRVELEGRLISILDIAASTLSLAGADLPAYLDGLPFDGSRVEEPRRRVYISRDRVRENLDLARVIRGHRFKYVRQYLPFQPWDLPEALGELNAEKEPTARRISQLPHRVKPVEALYDLLQDPEETRNLAGEPDHREVLEGFRRDLNRWMLSTLDVGLIPEPLLLQLEEQRGEGIYRAARGVQGLPLIPLLDVAQQSAEGLPGFSKLVRALRSEFPSIRYWGALGLGNLDRQALAAVGYLRTGVKDSVACVRIASARALCRMGRPEGLEQLVQELVSAKDWRDQFLAAHVVYELGDQALSISKPVVGVMESASHPLVQLLLSRWLEATREEKVPTDEPALPAPEAP